MKSQCKIQYRTGIALFAATLLLAGCGGGPAQQGEQDLSRCPAGQTGTPPDCTIDSDDPDDSSPTSTGGVPGVIPSGGGGSVSGPTPDGIPWDHDEDSSTPDIRYKFQTAYMIPAYMIPEIKEDDPNTDKDESMEREMYIMEREMYIMEREMYIMNNILRDAEYAELTAQTIPQDIFDIRAGIEVDEDGAIRRDRFIGDEDTLPLIAFGTERDSGNPHPLIAKRGVSMGIDTEAKKDIMMVRAQIARLNQYLARAEAAKQALEDEIARLTREANKLDNPDDGSGEAQKKQAEIDELNIMVDDLVADATRLRNEADALESEARVFTGDPSYTQDSSVDEAVRCTSASDCLAKAAERDLEAEAKDSERVMDEEMRMKLQTKIEQHNTDAADYRSQIPGLQGHVDTVQGHIDEINLLTPPLITTLEAEEAAADPSALARLIQDKLTGITLEGNYPRNTDGDADIDSADITALRGVRGRFAADRNPNELARAGLEAAEDLDNAGDAVFARAPLAKMEDLPTGVMTPVAALRVIAETHTATVEDLRLEASSGDPRALQALDANLGHHWRMNLDGHAPSEATPATDWTNTGHGDSTKGTFRGITGTFYCTSATCSDPRTADTFGAGWYFTPSLPATTENPNARDNPLLPSTQPTRFRYQDPDGDGVYEPLWYADYGMWLTWDARDDPRLTDLARLYIEASAGLVGPNGGVGRLLDLTTPNTPSNNLAARATYNGTARGLSARTQSRGGTSETASGHFTADVTLNARFGIPIADPGDGSTHEARLGGTITNFRPVSGQGSAHVNPAWRITLMEAVLNGAGHIRVQSDEYRWDNDDDESTPDRPCGTRLNCGNPETGVFTDDDVTGRWSAHGYIASGAIPEEGARPTGFYGGFVAAFDDDGIDQGTVRYPNGDGNLYDDGAAIGVYSADVP